MKEKKKSEVNLYKKQADYSYSRSDRLEKPNDAAWPTNPLQSIGRKRSVRVGTQSRNLSGSESEPNRMKCDSLACVFKRKDEGVVQQQSKHAPFSTEASSEGAKCLPTL